MRIKVMRVIVCMHGVGANTTKHHTDRRDSRHGCCAPWQKSKQTQPTHATKQSDFGGCCRLFCMCYHATTQSEKADNRAQSIIIYSLQSSGADWLRVMWGASCGGEGP
jgi:hypothetical protein